MYVCEVNTVRVNEICGWMFEALSVTAGETEYLVCVTELLGVIAGYY